MNLSQNQARALMALHRYGYMTTPLIRDEAYPNDRDCSVTRECMRRMLGFGYVRRHEPRLLEAGRVRAAPVYVLTIKGSCALAAQTGDMGLVLTVQRNFADWMSVHHYTSLSALHQTFDRAVAAQARVRMHALFFEHDVINPDAEKPEDRYRLQVAFSGSNVKCCPDSAFEIEVGGVRRALYVESEMGTDTPARVAAKKCKGYAELHKAAAFRRHFPSARDFRVLAFCPNGNWRDALMREMRDRPGAELWLFAARPDVTRESFLHGEIFHKMQRPAPDKPPEARGPFPLVPGPSPAAVGSNGAGIGGGILAHA